MSSSRSPPGGGKGNTAPLVVAAFLLGAAMGRFALPAASFRQRVLT